LTVSAAAADYLEALWEFERQKKWLQVFRENTHLRILDDETGFPLNPLTPIVWKCEPLSDRQCIANADDAVERMDKEIERVMAHRQSVLVAKELTGSLWEAGS
jgi:hypothetical protein